MKFIKLERDFSPLNFDRVFDKMKDFERILPYLYAKIEGNWRICLVDFRIADCRRIVDELDIPKHLDLEIYLKQDVLALFYSEYPSYSVIVKSKWEQYMELISVFPKTIERKASSELFKRCEGNVDTIRETLSVLLTTYEDAEVITIKHINAVIMASDTVYARDVILTLLLKNNNRVPKKGHRLARYKYNNYYDLYSQLERAVGKRVAFFAMRKVLKKLYEDKLAYLDNKELKDYSVVEVIDIYEITHAYMTFYLSNYDQVLVCLSIIEERLSNASSFETTILNHYDQYLGTVQR